VTDLLRDLIEASDLAGLVRYVERLAREGDWDGIVAVRDRCREAVGRGKQVWAPAEYAEYRLALDAPAPLAASVIADGKGRYGQGPLWEVAASTHPFAALGPHLDVPTTRALVAHERSLRGEDLAGVDIDPGVLPIPLEIQPWEPCYPLAEYGPDRVDFPEPVAEGLTWVELDVAGERVADEGPVDALLELVRPWWEDSSGKAEAIQVVGDARGAIRALGPHRARLVQVTPAEALAAMAWAGASGGAYGRRRGTPVGRANAWWAAAELAGYEEIPDEPAELGRALAALRWFRWDPGDRVGGWSLHLAVEDPDDGLAWAISAVDMR